MVNDEVKKYVERSVLCWLATSNSQNEPNVSPKEMFTLYDDTTLLIANIASPNTIQNIEMNAQVCVSFLDIFVEKGFKIKGIAKIIDKNNSDYEVKLKMLTDLFSDRFPIKSIIEINIKSISKIASPSYFLFPETTEEGQIKNAMKTYGVKPDI